MASSSTKKFMNAAIYSKSSPFGVKVVNRELPTLKQPLPTNFSVSGLCFQIGFAFLYFLHNNILKKILKIEEPQQSDIKQPMIYCEVKSGGLNPVDAKFLYGDKAPHACHSIVQTFLENRICGIDFSGVVIDAPINSTFKKGDEVFGTMPPTFGSFAEFVVCPSSSICLKPKNFNFNEAAAVPLVGLTALQCFQDTGLKSGEHVCILGASGGTGHVAVQIARALGARVTAVCSTKNVNFVKELDADDIVVYNDPDTDVIESLSSVCERQGQFNLVFDAVSSHDQRDNRLNYKQRIMKEAKLLHPRGMYINLGGSTLDWMKAHLKRFLRWDTFSRGCELFWVRFPNSHKQLDQLKAMCEQNLLRVKVGHKFPLTSEGVQNAFELQLSRRVTGKIIIEVSS